MWKGKTRLLCFGMLLFMAVAPVQAQEPPAITTISMELWPDYDQTALLVLMTGTLAADTPLPATVSVPLPTAATLHVVARFDANEQLIDDLVYTASAGQVRFTTPSPSFRVEYYLPYAALSDARQIDFEWTAPFDVPQFLPMVQEPVAAEGFTLSEPITEIRQNSNGLRYHVLAARRLAAGERFTVQLRYTLPGGRLSRVAISAPAPTTTAASTTLTDWVLIGLGSLTLIAAVVLISQGWRERAKKRPRKPRMAPPNATAARFCPQCGQALPQPNGRFCPQCGRAL